MNHMHDQAPARDWRRRPLMRVAVCLFSWWACGASYAVTFPSLPLQTGVSQPAPNVIFILDDSLSMTSLTGAVLDTGLAWCSNTSCPNQPTLGSGEGAPYTKNPLSYNPATDYKAWATANTTNTDLVRLADASYTSANDDDQFYNSGDTVDLSSKTRTYYVPKPSATNLADQRQYYRYQILSGGNRVVRAEWVNTASPGQAMLLGQTWTGLTGAELNWGSNVNSTANGNGSSPNSNPLYRYAVPADGSVTRISITTTGATGSSHNADLYVRNGAVPSTGTYLRRSNTTGTSNETINIDNPPTGWLYIGVYNAASGSGDRTFSNLTLTVRYSTDQTQSTLNCSTDGAGTYGWKNCVDVSGGDTTTKVRARDAEKQNYANWYQYHRTRMKTAKAGGSEAFAALDENYRVGIMGLYPYDDRQQVIGGSTSGNEPTTTDPGNMTDIIPVDTNGGLFIGDNRKNWFNYLHRMKGQFSTPLRQALNAAGTYFSTSRAYRSTVGGTTTYLACRQNFAILTTDGYWNNYGGEDPDDRYTGDKISGDEEAGKKITSPTDPDGYTYARQAPYWYNIAGSDKDDTTTLADVAMHYWKTDLRTTDVSGYAGSSDNVVPFTLSTNPAFWQHMVTFGVGLGVNGKLTDAQVADAVAGSGTLANGGFWPKPVHATDASENKANVDDLRHAALNGHGSFVNANDSVEFAAGIGNALNRIGERRGSASNVLANSTSISTESFVYQATYTAGSWRGELLAYPISDAGLGTPQWSASEHIRAWNTRNIFTVGATTGGSTFPNATQLTALGTAATSLGLTTGTQLADYLKGDRSLEKDNGGVLRDRFVLGAGNVHLPRLLGDIVDSSPFYAVDSQTVFVGANDGMLHAIDATNTDANSTDDPPNTTGGGTERFTYIPRGVAMSQLAELADPLYATNTSTKPHRFFVDGPIVVSSQARTPGANYLIGALGRGGKGVFGLDVTTPSTFGAGNVLWDNTGSGAPANMGNVISEPLISKLNNDVTAAVVANGPNSTSGTASLFILNLSTGAEIAQLDTSTTGNGLSAPRAVDVNADGKVDYFFAGDLLGNLWRFNVSATSAASWTVDKVFTATDSGGTAQAISSAPGAARDPTTGKIWIFFGTGRYMTATDQASTDTQTYYGVMVGADGSEGGGLDRSDLQEREIDSVDTTTGLRKFEPHEDGVDTGMHGWFVDLDNPAGTGERVISAPLIVNTGLVFSSIVPADSSTVNSCDAGGTGYVNAIDAFSGTSLAKPFFDYAEPIGSVPIGTGMPTAPILVGDKLVVGDSSGRTPTDKDVNVPGGTSTRRVSWREVLNPQ
jgi:type IV pilus assembly protein PilY1